MWFSEQTREYSEVLEVKCYFIWGSGKVAPLTGLPAASFSASLFLFFIPVCPHPPFLSPSPSPSLPPSVSLRLPCFSDEAGAKRRARPCYQQHTASVMDTSVTQLLRHQIAVIRWAAVFTRRAQNKNNRQAMRGQLRSLPSSVSPLWRMCS